MFVAEIPEGLVVENPVEIGHFDEERRIGHGRVELLEERNRLVEMLEDVAEQDQPGVAGEQRGAEARLDQAEIAFLARRAARVDTDRPGRGRQAVENLEELALAAADIVDEPVLDPEPAGSAWRRGRDNIRGRRPTRRGCRNSRHRRFGPDRRRRCS
jgi:hypothetical protein